ncbi:MAG: hypothetical protein ACQEQJ_04410 [Halobacteriota archaeon]|nr:hypothetical protein [Halodesulfurarchaeum formicicum]
MTAERTMIGVHEIDADGTIELDEAVFEACQLERDSRVLVVASPEGGITVRPVTTEFSPRKSGQ